jgi:peptidoglycan-associated lipoprotein
MKYFFWIILPLMVACSSTKNTTATPPVVTPTPAPAAPAPAPKVAFVQWDKKMVDLGKVKKGEKKSLFYEFTNTFTEDIQIEIVDACDCTKVEFPRGKIAPGAKGRLDVVFNSADKDADETIGINVIFTNVGSDGNPRIEVVEYKFNLEK